MVILEFIGKIGKLSCHTEFYLHSKELRCILTVALTLIVIKGFDNKNILFCFGFTANPQLLFGQNARYRSEYKTVIQSVQLLLPPVFVIEFASKLDLNNCKLERKFTYRNNI